MQVFGLTLSQMLMMFTFMVIGYALKKCGILPEKAGVTLSKLLVYVLSPSLTLSNYIEDCNAKTLTENSIMTVYGIIFGIIAIVLAYAVAMLFVPKARGDERKEYLRSMYRYALTFGNYGYVGYVLVLGVWGGAAFFRYSMFTLGLGVLCSTWGVFSLIPKTSSYGGVKAILNRIITPPMIAIVVGILLGLSNAKTVMPDFIITLFDNAGGAMGPVAMLLAGIVVSDFDLKQMFNDYKIYILALLRLILIPAAMAMALKAFGSPNEIVLFTIIAFATPVGMNTIIYPSAYGADTKTGAAMTVVTSILSVITIPVMYLIFVELI